MSYPSTTEAERRYALRVISEPFAEPVSLQEAKDHCRIHGDDEDALISAYLAAARRWVEDATGRQIVTATLRMTLDRFPWGGCGCRSPFCGSIDRYAIVVPRAALQSVSSITYVDDAGDEQTLDAEDYRVDVEREPGRITPAYGTTWPATRRQTGAVTMELVAGHLTPATADKTANTLTAQGRTFANDDVVRLLNSGGKLPAGLAANTEYHVVNASGSSFKLEATQGGSAIDFTDDGQGTHFVSNPSSGVADVEGLRAAIKLMVAHLYENREPVNIGNIVNEVPMGVEALISMRRVFA